jgi:hypothetical protein
LNQSGFFRTKVCYFFSTKKKSKIFGFFNYKGSANLTNFDRFFENIIIFFFWGGGENFAKFSISQI